MDGGDRPGVTAGGESGVVVAGDAKAIGDAAGGDVAGGVVRRLWIGATGGVLSARDDLDREGEGMRLMAGDHCNGRKALCRRVQFKQNKFPPVFPLHLVN
jgi:hypothetical protein